MCVVVVAESEGVFVFFIAVLLVIRELKTRAFGRAANVTSFFKTDDDLDHVPGFPFCFYLHIMEQDYPVKSQ